MTAEALLQAFENLARQLGIEVRYEQGDFEGGLCRVGDRRFLIINDALPRRKQLMILAREMRTLDLTGVHVLPALRKLMEQAESEE